MSLIGMAQNAYHAVCLATAIGCGVVASGAVTLDLKAPGELAEALSAVPSNTDELVLTGHVDASELIMLRDSLPGLLRLDMGRLDIVPATIHPYAFAAMPLTSVVLPDDVAVIGEAAFAALPITEIGLPQSLDSIAPYAFAHSLLSGVEIPENTAVIGRNAFGDCRNLAWLSGGAGLKKVGEYAFHGSALSEVNLSDAARLRYVGAGAFEDCGELYAVT